MIFIHHGRGVEQGLAEELEGKHLVADPISDLKVDAVKKLVELYSQVYPYKNPALLAGPLDDADPSTLDILLKRIEEPVPHAPELILWARDLGGVPDTIRSRCGEKYHYAHVSSHPQSEQGEQLYKALKDKNLLGIIDLIRSLKSGEERGLIEAYVEVALKEEDYGAYSETLKELIGRARISRASLFGYFLGVHP